MECRYSCASLRALTAAMTQEPCRTVQSSISCWRQATTEGLVGYELGSKERSSIQQRLDAFGRKKLEAVVREGSHTALSRMKDR